MIAENTTLARRWMREVWNERREETIDELLLPTSIGHMEGGDVVGPAGFRAVRAVLLDAVPDLRVVVEDAIAEGDAVALRWQATGTHRGGGFGFPATGRPVRVRGLSWLCFADGRLVEGWDSWNLGALLEELRS
jgi:steroid delta-isomerase-like uncharacterized protein